MKKLTIERAQELKAQGIEQIASICKSHYDSKYYKVGTIENILENGGKMPGYIAYNGYIHGIIETQIDWKKTIRWSDI